MLGPDDIVAIGAKNGDCVLKVIPTPCDFDFSPGLAVVQGPDAEAGHPLVLTLFPIPGKDNGCSVRRDDQLVDMDLVIDQRDRIIQEDT